MASKCPKCSFSINTNSNYDCPKCGEKFWQTKEAFEKAAKDKVIYRHPTLPYLISEEPFPQEQKVEEAEPKIMKGGFMECVKCKKTIPSGSKFCEFCGGKVKEVEEEKKVEKEKKIEKEAKTNDGEIPQGVTDIRNHLEFIGYEIDQNQIEDSGIIRFFATNPNRSNLIIAYFPTAGLFTFIANYTIKKVSSETQKDKLFRLVNQINNNVIISTFSVGDGYDIICCGTWYPDIYSKKEFSRFIDLFENEVRGKFRLEEFQEFLTD